MIDAPLNRQANVKISKINMILPNYYNPVYWITLVHNSGLTNFPVFRIRV